MLYNDNPVKIIIVGNNLLMPDILESMLDSRGFVLETVNSTTNAIAGVQKASPDVFLVDDMNSDQDVLSICQNIRHYSGVPILVLAADHKPGLVEQVLDAGADDFLVKPVSDSILAAHLNTLARRARAEKEAALSIVNGDSDEPNQVGLLSY